MTALYFLNMAKMQHNIICNGSAVAFDLAGKFVGSCGTCPSNARPVDIVSFLQENDMLEVASLSNGVFSKRKLSLSTAQAWISSCPARLLATLTIKRMSNGNKCIQTMYVFNHGDLARYLPVA